LEKEREAEKIVNEAKEKAKRIIENAEEEAKELYKGIYQKTIDQAKSESKKIKDKTKKIAESDAQIFLETAEEKKERIRKLAKKNFERAVNHALNEILS
jgi:vacuolar-type H+-ATPase subunit H